MSKKKKSNNIFTVLNEKIVSMGYQYSLTSFFKNFLLFSIFIILLGYLHKLHFLLIAFLVLAFLMLLPFSIYAQYKYLYEQKRFQELCTYLKQMKINFKAHKKILIALEETLTVYYTTDRIYPYMKNAIEAIKAGESYKQALDPLEQAYKNSYITKLHAFMILGETEGGDTVYQALDNIDFNTWQTDTTIYQTEKYKYQNQNAYYTMLGLVVSLAVIFMFQNIMATSANTLVNIFNQTSYQIETFIYILVDLISYLFIKTIITGKWIREDE